MTDLAEDELYEEPGHHEFNLRETSLTRNLDRIVDRIGEVFHWIWLALVAVIILNVVLRYVFSRGMIELEELQWYLYSIGWLVGLSYTFIYDGHVRVDVLHERLPYSGKLWFELVGLLVFFLPFVIAVIIWAIPFVELSWTTNERSTSANGLPARWLVKGFLLFAFFLLTLTGISRLLKVITSLIHGAPSNGAGASIAARE
ncbi:MAG: TRAP transporter small permease subunit [Methyloligellaceae bacterium]